MCKVQATAREGLGVVMFSGGYDRVHYALAMAAAAAASGRLVVLLVTGRALPVVMRDAGAGVCGWHGLDAADDGRSPKDRDRSFGDRGVATIEELVTSCAALGVSFIVCEMGLRAFDGPASAGLRDDIPATVGGIVGFLATVGNGSLLFI